jgi:hypothetical protein
LAINWSHITTFNQDLFVFSLYSICDPALTFFTGS